MDLDATLEWLAFGRALPRLGGCIGLYLSPEALFLSEARVPGGKPVVDHLLKVPLPPAGQAKDTLARLGGSLNTDALADPGKLADLLRPALAQGNWGAKHLMITLSHHFGLLRCFVMPAVHRRFWKTAVPTEARRYIPVQFTDLVHDFQVFPLPPGPDQRPRQGVLFGVTHRKNVDGAALLARKLALTLAGLEISPCSVERLWDNLSGQPPGPPAVRVHFDGGRARILLSERGLPIFFREALLPDGGAVPEPRKLDLAGCLDFSRKQLGAARPAQLQLSGLTPEQAGWKEVLAQDIDLPVAERDAAGLLGLKAGEWGAYASVGAAMRPLAPTPLLLDLSPLPRVTDEERRAAAAVFSVAGLLAAALLLLGGARYARVVHGGGKLGEYRRQGAMIAQFQAKTGEQIAQTVQEMEQRADALSGFVGARAGLTRAMEEIAENAPDALWLSAVRYRSDVADAAQPGRPSRALSLTGHVLGPGPAAEQDIAIRFREKLQADPRFGKVYACGGVSFTAAQPTPSSGPGEGRPPEPPPALAEGRTAFVIECAARR